MTKTALVIIDMIKDFAYPEGKIFYPENQQIIEPIKKLLKKAREKGLLRIFIVDSHRRGKKDLELELVREHCIAGEGGEEIIEEFEFDPETEFKIKKRRYSAFFGTDLDLILREHGIENLILVGTKTNNCIRATVHDAFYLTYKIIVPKECVATNDKVSHRVHLREIDRYFGEVKPLAEVLTAIDAGDL